MATGSAPPGAGWGATGAAMAAGMAGGSAAAAFGGAMGWGAGGGAGGAKAPAKSPTAELAQSWTDLFAAYSQGEITAAELAAQGGYSTKMAQLKVSFPGLSEATYNWLAALPTDPSGKFTYDYQGQPISLSWLAQNIASQPFTPYVLSQWKEPTSPKYGGAVAAEMAEKGVTGQKIVNPLTGEVSYQQWSSIPGSVTTAYRMEKGGASPYTVKALMPTPEHPWGGGGGIMPPISLTSLGFAPKPAKEKEKEPEPWLEPEPRMTWALAPSRREEGYTSRYAPPTRWLVY